METRYAALARCTEVPESEVLAALRSSQECAALLARIGLMPSPITASRALLLLLGRVATPTCTWLEGELAVELFDDEGGTKVRIMAEIGAGLREQLLPVVVLGQPLAELTVALAEAQELAPALHVQRVSSRCVLLLAYAPDGAPASTQFDISETSLTVTTGAAPTVEEVDSGWDDAASVA